MFLFLVFSCARNGNFFPALEDPCGWNFWECLEWLWWVPGMPEFPDFLDPLLPLFPCPPLTHALKRNHVWTFAGNFFWISWILPGLLGGKIPKFRRFPAQALEKSLENAGKEPKIPKDSLWEHKFWEFWEGEEKKIPCWNKKPGSDSQIPDPAGFGVLGMCGVENRGGKALDYPKKMKIKTRRGRKDELRNYTRRPFPKFPKFPKIQVPELSGRRKNKKRGKSQIFPSSPLDLRWNPTEKMSEFLWL